MKNLILIRHAKSSWDAPLGDFDRPLAERGVKDANLVSQSIASFLPKQYVVWSSPAKRARETALIFAQNLLFPLRDIVFNDDLYTFDSHQLEQVVRSIGNDVDSVILFGHNAAITNFVNKFGDVYIDNVTTSGFVSLEFDSSDWQSISKGKTAKIVFPRDLKT